MPSFPNKSLAFFAFVKPILFLASYIAFTVSKLGASQTSTPLFSEEIKLTIDKSALPAFVFSFIFKVIVVILLEFEAKIKNFTVPSIS